MGLDQDKIKKRLSQIEIDINQMNQMIDENLQLVEPAEDEAVEDNVKDTGVVDAVKVAETALFSGNDGADSNPGDSAQVEEHKTAQVHIPTENEANKSTDDPSQLSVTQPFIAKEQITHTAIAIGDSHNSFVANSAGNEKAKDSCTENKEDGTVNIDQNRGEADVEIIENNDDEWEDEKSDVEEGRVDKGTEENSEIESFKSPMPQNNTLGGENKLDAELVLDKFSSANKDLDIQPQTIVVGGDNEYNHESSRLADQTPHDDNSENCPNRSGGSTPLDSQTKIFIPKKNSKEDGTNTNHFNSDGDGQKKMANFETRRPTNPFRVISVSSNSNSRNGSRKSSLNKYDSPVSSPITSASELGSIAKLEKRHDYLSMKCIKLQKEIDYLNKMNAQGSLSMEDGKRLHRAVVKLQEYLDKKTKEKYEVGVLLSRHLRKQIDRGENGQFWIGTK
ncbi:BEM_collapsed_G0047060.mRNA.1.CDS.1 [Saccharomyces cerevisiae]|nr:CQI_4a_G0044940.mRNA.1.CDS.1 [Saccharomyces cerevisiae]CAI5034341.1 BEM_HP_G0040890.mRNA.1.CDS.1 [Saccharomyces cerevisiae]CAI5200840.1 BEM_HP_G0098330.mRNA.1.CDS.1 [Saccharomyces cerevisiae]CAI6951372.1 BEM_HP_G0040890.mRNA.1.CDS.1 [Saccharomyces cerevisiae]CAI7006056.1 BEM_HP_G0098330.mRNA.1.CDS.1 [Saccharomyces cerevisiae]